MIQDKKTGEEIVYNVNSSSGYVADEHYGDENNLQTIEDDNHFHHSMITTTQATTTTAVPTTTFDLEKLREKRRKALAMKMRHMFKSLGNKYKKEKEKILKIPKELFSRKPQRVFTTPTTTKNFEPTTRKVPEVAEEQDDEEVVFVGDDFDDFVPMEYEVVEDVIIENY